MQGKPVLTEEDKQVLMQLEEVPPLCLTHNAAESGTGKGYFVSVTKAFAQYIT